MRAAGQVGGGTSRRGDPASHIHMSVAERRHFTRGKILINIKLVFGDEIFDAVLIDISAGGAQLRSSFVPRIGLEMGIEIQSFGVLKAKVVRRLANSFAIEFDFQDEERSKWAKTIETLLKIPL